MENPQIGVSLIETEELAALLESSPEQVKLVNATWYFGSGNPDPLEQYREAHIENDVYFDISHVADKNSGLLATLPSLDHWISECKRLGVKRNHTIVIYETEKIYAGPRAAWMFR